MIYHQVFRIGSLHLHHFVLFINVTMQIFKYCTSSVLLFSVVNVLSSGYKNNYLPWMTLLSLTSSHWPFQNCHYWVWASKIGQIHTQKKSLNCQPSCELTGLEIKKARYLYTFNMFRQQQSQRGPWYLDMSRLLLSFSEITSLTL